MCQFGQTSTKDQQNSTSKKTQNQVFLVFVLALLSWKNVILGQKEKYIFLTSTEASTLENKLIVALSGGFSEIEIRSGAVPITLCVNGETEFSLVHGGKKAG